MVHCVTIYYKVVQGLPSPSMNVCMEKLNCLLSIHDDDLEEGAEDLS